MRILAVDIGTGTQDILLFDSDREVENCLKMVMPSPTTLLADAVSILGSLDLVIPEIDR